MLVCPQFGEYLVPCIRNVYLALQYGIYCPNKSAQTVVKNQIFVIVLETRS